MLQDLWPGMVEDKALLSAADVWEGTRYCIDKDVEPALRTRIIHEMAAAYLEFGLQAGIRKIIGDADLHLSQRVRKARHRHGVSGAGHHDRRSPHPGPRHP